jgi:L-asparaginase II
VHAVKVRDGAVVDAQGDPELVTFWRSSAKPFQALPLVRVAPEVTDEEVAVACASHRASDEQLAAVRSLLGRARARVGDLACGAAERSRIRHNCSGKHAGMLLVCRRRGWPLEGYHQPDHPLQEELARIVSDVTGLVPETAIDGCGLPTYALPLAAMAAAFARLGAEELPGADRVIAAMRAHPGLVGGDDAVDTRLMRALPGTVAKRGAEGLLCAALPDGTGLVLKVEDGAQRAIGPAAAHVFGVDGLLEEAVLNSRGEVVGAVLTRS